MLGWTILFGLMTLPGATAAISGYSAGVPVKASSMIFAALFLISLLTRIARSSLTSRIGPP